MLVGLNMYTGDLVLDEDVDPPGQPPSAILQRTGLNLQQRKCGVRVRRQRRRLLDLQRLGRSRCPRAAAHRGLTRRYPSGNDGAVWMGGAAPEVDGAGNIWVATGNGSSSTPYDFSDWILQLSPGLARTQFSPRATGPS